MRERLSTRLQELKAELQKGREAEADLENRLAQLRTTLLRITGAIQVLEEVLDNDVATLQAAAEPVEPVVGLRAVTSEEPATE